MTLTHLVAEIFLLVALVNSGIATPAANQKGVVLFGWPRHTDHRIQFYNHQPRLGSRRIECQFLVACVDCEFPYFVQYAKAKEHGALIIVMDHSGDHVENVITNADQVYGDDSHSFMHTVGKL